MRTSWIISFATVCGVSVAVYTLATGAIRRRPRMQTPTLSASGNMQASQSTESLEDLEALIAREPEGRRVVFGFSHFRLAQRYTEAGRLDDARAAWEEAARRRLAAAQSNPERESFWFEAGWALWKLGRLEEARSALMEAERLASLPHPAERSEEHWYRLGWARRILGFDQESALAFGRALEFLPATTPEWDAEGHYRRARYNALLNAPEAALVAFEKAAAAGFDRPEFAAHSDDFETICEDPRFQRSLERMRMQPRRFEFGPG